MNPADPSEIDKIVIKQEVIDTSPTNFHDTDEQNRNVSATNHHQMDQKPYFQGSIVEQHDGHIPIRFFVSQPSDNEFEKSSNSIQQTSILKNILTNPTEFNKSFTTPAPLPLQNKPDFLLSDRLNENSCSNSSAETGINPNENGIKRKQNTFSLQYADPSCSKKQKTTIPAVGMEEMLRKILANQEEIKNELKSIRNDVDQIKSTYELFNKMTNNNVILRDPDFMSPALPLEDDGAVYIFNAKLNDRHYLEQMVLHIRDILLLDMMNTTKVQCNIKIKSIMEALMTYDVLKRYSWSGLPFQEPEDVSSKKFSELTGIVALVLHAVNYQNTPMVHQGMVVEGLKEFLKRKNEYSKRVTKDSKNTVKLPFTKTA